MTITPQFKIDLEKVSNEFKEWKEAGGNYFNIFDALGVSEKENYHSAFIAYLLDYQNGHYQDKFAKLFFEKLPQEKIPDKFKIENRNIDKMSVSTEEVTKEIKKDRRIDILLTLDRNVSVIIENKIYAKDQKAQIKDYVIEIHKRYSTENKANYPLVIYLHPNKKAEPSEISFTNTGGKWELNANKGEIYDNKGYLQAYYLKLDYAWIVEWIESCIEWLNNEKPNKPKNEFDKIIFGLNQYIEILKWYITGDYDENNTVTQFIMENNKNQQMALKIMHSKDKDLHKDKDLYKCKNILKELWNEICVSVVEKFYSKLLEKFETKEVKINDKIWLCERLDENRVYYEQFRFYPQEYEGYTNFPRLFLYYDGSHFKDIGLGLSLCYKENLSAKDYEKLKAIFQRNNGKNGINKYKDSYVSTKVFTDKPTDSPIENFAEWLIKQGDTDKQVEIFIKKIDEYIKNNSLIKDTLTELDKFAKA